MLFVHIIYDLTLLPEIKSATFLTLLLFVSVFVPPLWSASDGARPSPSVPQSNLSADDFDWRDVVSYLSVAAALPAEQGIKIVLENSKVLRAYVANEVRSECRPADKNPCVGKQDRSTVDEEVSRRIDKIVQEGIFHLHKAAMVDLPLSRQPFPFSEISALKSENRKDAYLLLELTDHSYTADQVQAKYGVRTTLTFFSGTAFSNIDWTAQLTPTRLCSRLILWTEP